MVHTSLNIFDLVVLSIIGISALLSFFRGFVREVLSLGAWAGASVFTLYTFPAAAKYFKPYVNSPEVASGFAAVTMFVLALIIFSILNRLLLKFFKSGSEVGLLDNLIGLTFGTARGVLLVAVGYLVLTLVMQPKDYPDWMKESASRPYVAKWSQQVRKLAPSYFDEILNSAKNKARDHDSDTELKKLDDEDAGESEASKELKNLPTMNELQQRMREENEK